MLKNIPFVKEKLDWMQQQKIWPNGLRYLWTDAFGLVLYCSLYEETRDKIYLEKAEQLVDDVYRVLGRERGIRIGEAPDRHGQYFHYLAMWLFALHVLSKFIPKYHEKAIELVKEIHVAFVERGTGVWWKMKEDLSGPEPGFGMGAMDAFDGYISYKLIDENELEQEIREMKTLISKSYKELQIDQDLGLGMMLWLSHFAPDEKWAHFHRDLSLEGLQRLWIDPPGYFCRQHHAEKMKFAFTNYGISVGLQSVNVWEDKVKKANKYFQDNGYKPEYAKDSITHVMECVSHFPGLFIKENLDKVKSLAERTVHMHHK